MEIIQDNKTREKENKTFMYKYGNKKQQIKRIPSQFANASL
jgi:hypothetical protein